MPLPFEIFATIRTVKFNEVEKLIHKTIDRLTDLRIRQNREFFNIQPQITLDILRDISTTIDDAVIELYHNNQPVVAAIIIKEDQVFATQRGYGEFKGWWEFPGGKIESGECPQEALKREIREELEADIQVNELLETVEWDYPNFHLTMHCFISNLLSESLHLNEHEAATWLNQENLRSVKWLPADEILLDKIADYLR